MIVHVDMDAFYASVEQRDHPDLRGKPVVVGGGSGRSVVSAASYEAREYGIHSAMSGRRAAELCPHAVFVRGDLSKYADVGRQVREIFQRYTPIVQPLSLDEAFLDLAGTERLHGDAESVGVAIRNDIREELDLPASVGIAPRKFVAKIASDLEKPNGFVVVTEEKLISFLDPLPVSRLWGVGKVGAKRLDRLSLRTFRDIRVYDQELLASHLGEWGRHLWRLANGIDARQVVADHRSKQISHERTFSSDLTDISLLRSVVCSLCEQTALRLRRHDRKCLTIGLKYRREDFRTFSRSITLPAATDSTTTILETATGLLDSMRRDEPRPVRLIGVSLSSLTSTEAPQQLSLFEDEEHRQAERSIDRVADELKDRLGQQSIYRGSSHQWRKRK
ncbi:MAG: DNA polymerase IV [Planctomycetota bacterium]